MHFPRPGQQPTTHEKMYFNITDDDAPTDIIAADADDTFFSFTRRRFKYLGTIFTNDLNDSHDINERIRKAKFAFYSLNRQIFRNKSITKELRL
jgi:hypothetical protein